MAHQRSAGKPPRGARRAMEELEATATRPGRMSRGHQLLLQEEWGAIVALAAVAGAPEFRTGAVVMAVLMAATERGGRARTTLDGLAEAVRHEHGVRDHHVWQFRLNVGR